VWHARADATFVCRVYGWVRSGTFPEGVSDDGMFLSARPMLRLCAGSGILLTPQ
jgi:hypothetical protein